jgi:hypothetical protein
VCSKHNRDLLVSAPYMDVHQSLSTVNENLKTTLSSAFVSCKFPMGKSCSGSAPLCLQAPRLQCEYPSAPCPHKILTNDDDDDGWHTIRASNVVIAVKLSLSPTATFIYIRTSALYHTFRSRMKVYFFSTRSLSSPSSIISCPLQKSMYILCSSG